MEERSERIRNRVFQDAKDEFMKVEDEKNMASVVWCPIPIVSWIMPFVGHVGITLADGTTLDFSGPFLVTRDRMLFGTPTRNVKLSPMDAERWNRCVQETETLYGSREYNFFTQNCHHFVVETLNLAEYRRKDDWNLLDVAWMCFIRGKHVGWKDTTRTWIPFLLVMIPSFYFGTWIFAVTWLGIVFLFCTWFVLQVLFV